MVKHEWRKRQGYNSKTDDIDVLVGISGIRATPDFDDLIFKYSGVIRNYNKKENNTKSLSINKLRPGTPSLRAARFIPDHGKACFTEMDKLAILSMAQTCPFPLLGRSPSL